MRNLLVISDGYPQLGTNRYLKNFVKEFTDLVNDQFDEVYVISPQPYFPKFLRRFKIFKKFYIYSNFKDYNYGNVKVFFPTYFTLPLKVFRDLNRKFRFNKIKNIIQKNKFEFDIAHIHFARNGMIGVELKKFYKNSKIIVHCHDSTLKKDLNISPEKYKIIFRGVDATISFCEQFNIINNFLTDNHIKNNNTYISNFVNTKRFYPKNNINELRKKYGFKINDTILICVSNIINDKGQNDILEIWNDLSKIIKNLNLILIGDGADKNKLSKKIKDLKDNHIHYLGPKSNEDIIDYLNISNLFVFPSKHETFGIAPIESIACGTPVISYKNGGTEYIINDNEVGTILEKQNINLLKKGIINMLNIKQNREYLHKYIDDNYSGKIVKKILIDLYFNN